MSYGSGAMGGRRAKGKLKLALQGIGWGSEPLSYAPVHPNEEDRSPARYRTLPLGLTPPWTLANWEPDGRKKTPIALSRRSGSIRVLLELDGLALRQREQFDLVRACGCAAIP